MDLLIMRLIINKALFSHYSHNKEANMRDDGEITNPYVALHACKNALEEGAKSLEILHNDYLAALLESAARFADLAIQDRGDYIATLVLPPR